MKMQKSIFIGLIGFGILALAFVLSSALIYDQRSNDIRSQAQEFQEIPNDVVVGEIRDTAPIPPVTSEYQIQDTAPITGQDTPSGPGIAYATLITPEKNSTAHEPMPQFRWDPLTYYANKVLTYTIQISTVPTFATTLVSAQVTIPAGATSIPYTPSVALPTSTTIYWRVRGVYGSVIGPWNESQFTSAGVGPSMPAPTTPVSGANAVAPVQLTWTAGTSPTGAGVVYDLQVSTQAGANFTQTLEEREFDHSGTSISFPSLTSGKTYYWRVRAKDTASKNYSVWSPLSSFRLLPEKPVLKKPTQNSEATALRPEFSWSGKGATTYRLQVSTVPTFATVIINQSLANTVTSWTPTTNLPSYKQLYWRVIALSSVGNIASDTYNLTSALIPSAPTITAPLTNTSVTQSPVSITFTSPLTYKSTDPNSTDLAGPYQKECYIEVSRTAGTAFANGIFQMKTHSPCAPQTIVPGAKTAVYTKAIDPLPDPGTIYYIRVRGSTKIGTVSAWSPIVAVKYLPAVPTPLAPTNGSTAILVTNPVFDWSDVTGATSYNLQASLSATGASPFISVNVKYASQYQHPTALPEGKMIYWRVQSVSAAGVSAWSPLFSFVSADLPTAPTLKAPVTNTLFATDRPVFTWNTNSVPTPARFEIELSLSTGLGFDSTIVQRATLPYSTAPSYTATALERGKIYYWRVRAISSKGEISPWSTIWSIKVQLPAPTLKSPATGVNAPATATEFSWNAVPQAGTYTIQASLYPTFSSTLWSVTNIYETTRTSTVAFPVGKTIYWRVRGDAVAGAGAWSETRTFIATARPKTPAGPYSFYNNTDPGQSRFVWNYTLPRPYAYPYPLLNDFDTCHVQLSKNAGIAFEDDKILDVKERFVEGDGQVKCQALLFPANATKIEITFLTTRVVVPVTGTYYWRVRVSYNGIDSLWSPQQAVTITKSP